MSREPARTVNLQGKQYQKVAFRVSEFRRLCPITMGWGLVTGYTDDGTTVVWRAAIEDPQGKCVATGHSMGKLDDSKQFEKLESVAIGRALAAAGLGGEEYATADEMLVYQEGRPEPTPDSDTPPEPDWPAWLWDLLAKYDMQGRHYQAFCKSKDWDAPEYWGEDEQVDRMRHLNEHHAKIRAWKP